MFLHRMRHKQFLKGYLYSATLNKSKQGNNSWQYDIHVWIGPLGVHIFGPDNFEVIPDFHF